MGKLNRIWILAGQSWCSGEAALSGLASGRTGFKQTLKVFANSPTFESLDSSTNNNAFGSLTSNAHGLEFEFLDLPPLLDSEIYLLKFAIGGTYLAQTLTDDWNTASAGKSYDNLKTYITAVKNWMTARGKNYKFEGIIWQQGGADANNDTDAGNYQTNLTNFVNGINTHVNEANFRWYIEQIPSALNARTGFAAVKAAQTAVVAGDATLRRLIDVDDVVVDETLHPTAAGNITLGQHFLTSIKSDLGI